MATKQNNKMVARKVSSKAPNENEINQGSFLDSLSGKVDAKMKRLSMPPIVRPSQMEGRTIAGKIIGTSYSDKYEQDLLVLKHDNGTEFVFPVTAAISRALARHQGVSEDKLDLAKTVGSSVAIRGLGQVKTRNGKRNVNQFEVYIR